jgi:hypothetical protein
VLAERDRNGLTIDAQGDNPRRPADRARDANSQKKSKEECAARGNCTQGPVVGVLRKGRARFLRNYLPLSVISPLPRYAEFNARMTVSWHRRMDDDETCAAPQRGLSA